MPVVKDTMIRVVAYDYDNSGYYKSVAGSNADKQIWAAPSAESQRIRATSVVTNTPRISVPASPRPDVSLSHITQDMSNGGYLNSHELGDTVSLFFVDGSDEHLG